MSPTHQEPAFRVAARDDLQAVLGLIADDAIGSRRERADETTNERYEAAFAAMNADPNQCPLIAEFDGQIVGYLQLTYIPGLSRGGAWRGLIESVRIASSLRGRGIGTRFMKHAIDRCRTRGCALVQLTTDRRRVEALQFYEALGFEASHHGMKLLL